jgi:hypothetical protein
LNDETDEVLLGAVDPPQFQEWGLFLTSLLPSLPEFSVLRTVLSSPYSVDVVRRLVAKCLEVIKSKDSSSICAFTRSNASCLLAQLIKSLWPRLRAGTFLVDAINVLRGFEASDRFFCSFFKIHFDSTLAHRDSDPMFVLLSLLSVTRDVETNALADFFAERCKKITEFCHAASDVHLRLFSILLPFDRPSGPCIQ